MKIAAHMLRASSLLGVLFAMGLPWVQSASGTNSTAPSNSTSTTSTGSSAGSEIVRTISNGKIVGSPPPGMVEVPAGDALVGITEELANSLIEVYAEQLGTQSAIAGCYPQHKVELPSYFIDIHETTNRQFKIFLDATGRKTPEGLSQYTWRYFDPTTSKDIVGEFNPKEPNVAIGAVIQSDAADFAKWSGRRLPTEAEWTRAARGDEEKNLFVWGDEWSKSKSSCGGTQRGTVAKVMSYKEDVSWCGVFDLMGNVSEWTSSPYDRYPDYKPLKFGRRLTLAPSFSRVNFSVRGGSVEGRDISNNCYLRQGFPGSQAFSLIGFRTAKSIEPGIDTLRYAIKKDLILNSEVRHTDNELAWDDIGAQEIYRASNEDEFQAVEGYDTVAFGHVKQIRLSKPGLERGSIEEPKFLLAFTSTKPMLNPDLPAGSYAVFYKAEGISKAEKQAARENRGRPDDSDEEGEGKDEVKGEADEKSSEDVSSEEGAEEKEEQQEREISEVEYPRNKDVLLFKASSGIVVAWLPAPAIREGKPSPSMFAYTRDEEGSEHATYHFTIEGATSRKAFEWELSLKFPSGSFRVFAPEIAEGK